MEFLQADHLKQRTKPFYPMLRWMWIWVLPALVLSLIVFKVNESHVNWNILSHLDGFWLISCLILLPVNLFLEAYTWFYLTRELSSRRFLDVWKVTLVGRSVNFLTPFGLGDAAVRVGDIVNENRIKAVSTLAVARMGQMIPTFILGSVSVLFLFQRGAEVFSLTMVLLFGLGLLLLLIVLYRIFKVKIHVQLDKYRLSLMNFERKQWLSVVSLSFCRYAVFSFQFVFVFYALDIDLSMHIILLGVFWVFLIKTFIPNVTALGDLMNRELSAVFFFSFFSADLVLVGMASALIWLINMVAPAVIGLFFVSGLSRKHL